MADSHAADVQAELQQYLNSKNINSLFISIVENLLIEKPANPIAFMIEYLYKQYPEQAKVALDTLAPAGRGSGPAVVDAKAEAKGPEVKSASLFKSDSKDAAKKSADDSDEDEDDDGDDVADIPVVQQNRNTKGGNRRISVSAESMDPAKLKAQASQVTNIPKSPEIHAKLLQVVGKSPLLRMLDPDQKEMIVKAFSGPIVKPVGENIITQGDIGDTFYLLEDGTVDVYIKKGGADEIKVHTYKPGDSFGELAIMYNCPRAATCRVATEATLWALDRVSFKVIVVAAAMQKRETYKAFLQQVPILQSLTEMEILTLSDSLAEETYQSGEVICQQGAEGNYFYIIKEGNAECYQADAAGEQRVVASLAPGHYFGEIALLTSKPRQATVKAVGGAPLKVLAIDRATFTRVFGPLEEIMKRNIEQYIKYATQSI
jgi:cAMP-dependent protein kinase regulator